MDLVILFAKACVAPAPTRRWGKSALVLLAWSYSPSKTMCKTKRWEREVEVNYAKYKVFYYLET